MLLGDTNGGYGNFCQVYSCRFCPRANGQAPFCLAFPHNEYLWHLPSQRALPLVREGNLRKGFFCICCTSSVPSLKLPLCNSVECLRDLRRTCLALLGPQFLCLEPYSQSLLLFSSLKPVVQKKVLLYLEPAV